MSSLCHRAFTVQKAVLLLNRVLKEPSVHAQLSVMGLSAPLVVEACIAPVWDSQSHLEAAKSASTVDKEPSLQYENAILKIYQKEVACQYYSFFNKNILIPLSLFAHVTNIMPVYTF